MRSHLKVDCMKIYLIYSVLYVQIGFLMTLDLYLGGNSLLERDGEPVPVVKLSEGNLEAVWPSCFRSHFTGLTQWICRTLPDKE